MVAYYISVLYNRPLVKRYKTADSKSAGLGSIPRWVIIHIRGESMNKWQKYRKEFHLSVDYVSRCLRLHTQDYLEIENGNREPTKEEYSKLLTLYGLAVQKRNALSEYQKAYQQMQRFVNDNELFEL